MNVFKVIKAGISRNNTSILIGFGLGGIGITGYYSGLAAIKAHEKIKELEESLGRKATLKEKGKAVWKDFIPPVAIGTGTAICILGADSIHTKRTAAAAGAFSLSQKALTEFIDNTEEVVGEKNLNKIKEKIVEKKIDDNPIVEKDVIKTGYGEQLCFDSYSGRYFMSDIESIRKVVNDLNERLIHEDYVSLNDFYWCVGLPEIDLGNDLGWNIHYDGQISIEYTSMLNDQGVPCLVLQYNVAPTFEYSDPMK